MYESERFVWASQTVSGWLNIPAIGIKLNGGKAVWSYLYFISKMALKIIYIS